MGTLPELFGVPPARVVDAEDLSLSIYCSFTLHLPRPSADGDLELKQSCPHADRLTGLIRSLCMAGASAVAITPGFVADLVGPSGVYEPTSFGLAGWAQQLKPLETSNVGQAVHTRGKPLDDFFTSLRWDFQGIDLHDTHRLCVSAPERWRNAKLILGQRSHNGCADGEAVAGAEPLGEPRHGNCIGEKVTLSETHT